ncbi:MAG: 50S ribosomal protein L9 [Ignavibacteria bacterium]|jgi:large subunit ribosomal protein L9|nr:50S ribosomal protein L9 [Ignavibacteria bacterium]
MKIILRKNIDKLGKMGDVVTVKDGFARNYLIPRDFAFVAKAGATKRVEFYKQQQSTIAEKAKMAAQQLAEKMSDLQISIAMKVGEASKLYGSVSNALISNKLSELGYTIDRHDVLLDEPIKTLGIFDVKVKLHPEVTPNVKVWVIAEEEPQPIVLSEE